MSVGALHPELAGAGVFLLDLKEGGGTRGAQGYLAHKKLPNP